MTTLQLTTVATVKQLMGSNAPVSAAQDALLATLVTAVSAAIEASLNRKLMLEERTETVSPAPGQRTIFLAASPVVIDAEDDESFVVKQALDRDFAAASAEDADTYYVDAEAGLLHLDGGFTGGPGTVQVTYTGGFAADQATLATAYPEIAQAAAFWVKNLFEKRNQDGTTSESTGSVSKQQDGLGAMPDVVDMLIGHHRRPLLR